MFPGAGIDWNSVSNAVNPAAAQGAPGIDWNAISGAVNSAINPPVSPAVQAAQGRVADATLPQDAPSPLAGFDPRLLMMAQSNQPTGGAASALGLPMPPTGNADNAPAASPGPTAYDPMTAYNTLTTQAGKAAQEYHDSLLRYKAMAEQANQIRQQAFSQPYPVRAPVTPIEAGIAVLGNLLDRHHVAGSQGLQALIAGLQNQQQQQVAAQTRAGGLANIQAQGLEQQGLIGSQIGQSGLQNAMQQLNTEAMNQYRFGNQQERALRDLRTEISAANGQVLSGKGGEQGMQAAAARQLSLEKSMMRLDPTYSPTAMNPQQVSDAYQQMIQQKIQPLWNTYTKTLTNQFGEIGGPNLADAQNTRASYMQLYGIKDPNLLPIPTGATLKQQAQDSKISEFSQMFGLDQSKLASQNIRTALAQAGLQEYRANRLGIMAQMASNGVQVANTSQARLALDEWKAGQNTANKSLAIAGQKLDGDIAALKEQLHSMSSSDPRLAAIQTQLAGKAAQRDYITAQVAQPDDVDAAYGRMHDLLFGAAYRTAYGAQERSLTNPGQQGPVPGTTPVDPTASPGGSLKGPIGGQLPPSGVLKSGVHYTIHPVGK